LNLIEVANVLTKQEQNRLEILAEQIRLEALKAIVHCGRGHVGGAMSMADALAVLYGDIMRYDPERPRMENRDRFVLSKGHAGPGLYAALALAGFYPMDALKTLNQPHTSLPSHCDMNKTPGVDMSSGSLGLGLSAAIGMALASRVMGVEYDTYVMIGDGECDEGQIWEGLLMAAHHKVDNLVALFDVNKDQLDGQTEDICGLGDLAAKLREFGWHTREVDGHSVSAIHEALLEAKEEKGRPSTVVLNTVKGYGCPNVLRLPVCHAVDYLQPEAVRQGLEDISYLEKKIEGLKGGAAGNDKA